MSARINAEYVVRENGLSAPVDLIGVESGYAASPEYLRDVRLEAERVRQPRDVDVRVTDE